MVDKKNVLLVDNTTSMISPWKNDVKTYFNCIEVIGGFEAISKLKTGDFVGVIVNLSIRTFNGLDVVFNIRDKFRNVPIIVIADKSDIRFIKNAVEYGVKGYLLFPIKSEELLKSLEKATGISLIEMTNAIDTELQRNRLEESIKTEIPSEKKEDDIHALYYEGQSALLNEDIEKAINVFSQIFNINKVKDSARKYWEESIFQLGRCLIKKDQYKDGINKMELFMQRAPNSDLYKQAYLLVGECYETMNDINKALSIYKKLIDMPPFDSISTKARKKAKALQESH